MFVLPRRSAWLLVLSASAAPWSLARGDATLLTRAADVRALTQEDAARGHPVRLQGVVLGEAEPPKPERGRAALVILDDTEGIYIWGPRPLVSGIQRGDVVEVEGQSDPGGFAPCVTMRRLVRLGSRRIPDPKRVTFEQLLSGRLDAQWVEVSGIVRRGEQVPQDPPKAKLEVASGGGRLPVQVNAELPPGAYVDAEVRLRGICFSRHNTSRQVLSPLLLVPRSVAVVVDVPAPAPPRDAPSDSVARLLQFGSHGANGHRVQVRGVVIHHRPGELLWIRDGERGLRSHSPHAEPLRPGDEVDVLGFPNRGPGDYTPVLEDAVFTRRGTRPPPVPIPVASVAGALKHDADLVQLEARLAEMRPAPEGWALTLHWNDSPVQAFVRVPADAAPPPEWRLGSIVRVAGICSVVTTEAGPLSGIWEPRSFQLLLRSPEDVRVVQAPPFWTEERVIALLSAMAGVSLLAVAGVAVAARNRLREQALRRAMAEAEFSAMLAERNRVAREIHDTLAQGLGAISMHLELVKDRLRAAPDGVMRHLETAHRLVRSSLADARASIWNMRSQALEDRDLAGALEALARQLPDVDGTEVVVQVAGRSRRLPTVTENNLLRIGQEAIVNATKHARAGRIEVRLEFSDKQVHLSVRDDGRGFDTARPPSVNGAFGLVDMRERAAELRSELTVRSIAGHGTQVSLSVPLPG